MSKIYEGGIGKILDNVSTLLDYIAEMPLYTANNMELEIPVMRVFLNECMQANADEAAIKLLYSQAVDHRVQVFKKAPNCLLKTLPFIAAAIDSQYGRTSVHTEKTKQSIRKMRGAKLVSKMDTQSPETTISQAQTSYGSIIAEFKDLIAIIKAFQPAYVPRNPNITVAKLEYLKAEITNANTELNTTYINYKQALDIRNTKLIELSDKAKKLKDAIKEIYGVSSSEYKQVRKLKV